MVAVVFGIHKGNVVKKGKLARDGNAFSSFLKVVVKWPDGKRDIPLMDFVLTAPACPDWYSTIGLFVMNFGILDYHVFAFLKDRLSPEEFVKVKELHFNNRVSAIGQRLKDENYPAEECALFERLAERIQPIRELRNHIAHGYMCFQPGPAGARLAIFRTKDLDMERLPSTKDLEFKELENALGTLNESIGEFERLAGWKAG